MYAHFKKLLYFSTECLYAPFAARGLARTYIKARPALLSTLRQLQCDGAALVALQKATQVPAVALYKFQGGHGAMLTDWRA